jgi:hypothetical protein
VYDELVDDQADAELAPGDAGAADETPPAGIDAAAAAAIARENQAGLEPLEPVLPGHRPLATPQIPGCRTRLNENNYSTRNGAALRLGVLHFSVSDNVPGWADVDGLAGYLDRTATQASATFISDLDGHCLYTVDIRDKAWTQGFFNPWSFSVECVARGTETKAWWERHGCLTTMPAVFAHVMRIAGIPARPAVTSGCSIVRSGITDHDYLGCGNSHWDMGPWCKQTSKPTDVCFPMGKFRTLVARALERCDLRVAVVERALNQAVRPRPRIVVGAPFGPRAQAAMRRFQHDHGLRQTGTITRAAARKLGLCS